MRFDVSSLRLGPGGINLLRDSVGIDGTGSPDGQITEKDVVLTTTGSAGNFDGVRFDIHLGRDFSLLDSEVDFDLGVPGLGLEVDGGVILTAGFDFVFGIGIDFENGVYFDTSDDSELEVFVEAMIPNLSAAGELGFLRLDVDELPKAVATTSPIRDRNASIRGHVIPDGDRITIKNGNGTIDVPLSDVEIAFVHQSGIGDRPTVAFDPTTAKLTFTIEDGVTTANQIVSGLNLSDVAVGDVKLNKLFRATTGPHSDGSGTISVEDSATTALSGTSVRADFKIDLFDPSNLGPDAHRVNGDSMMTMTARLTSSMDAEPQAVMIRPTQTNWSKPTIGELLGSDFDQILGAELTVDANVDLLLTASFGGDASLPRVRSDFSLDWDFRKSFGVSAPVDGENQNIDIPRFDSTRFN